MVCGSSEFCIRAPSPLIYALTSLLVFAAAARLYDEATGFWASLLLGLAPGTAVSARLMTTDVPMLFCIALFLYALVRLREAGTARWGALAGLALGVGLMAKYAMAFMLLGLIVLAVVAPKERRWLFSRQMALALLVAIAVVLPHFLWNAASGFVTVGHSSEVVGRGGLGIRIGNGLKFLAAQFAIMGPLVMAAFLLRAVGRRRSELPDADRLLLSLAVPVYVAVTAQATLFRAYDNWAAAGALPAFMLAAAVLMRLHWTLPAASAALGAAAQIALAVADTMPERIVLPFVRGTQPYAKLAGWRQLAEAAQQARRQTGAEAIATNSRAFAAELTYYARLAGVEVLAWGQEGRPAHHFELTRPLTGRTASRLIFVTECPFGERLAAGYAGVIAYESAKAPTARGRAYLFLLDQPRTELLPRLARCLPPS